MVRCKDCEYCEEFRKAGNTRSEFRCNHPDQRYIATYFKEKRISKMPGFLGFGKSHSSEVSVKTSPAWCPKKSLKEKENGK